MKSRLKRLRRLKPPLLNVARSMGKWRPEDDFLLIQSVFQLNNLKEVKKLTKFSKKFTLKEIRERWYAILHDQPISKLILKKVNKIHCDDLLRLKEMAPFSDKENELLLGLESKLDKNEDEFFEKFLIENRILFHESRTPSALKKQWNLLIELKLLKDQTDDLDNDENENNSLKVPFSVIEDRLDDDIIMENVEIDEEHEQEMKNNYDSLLKEIRRAEADVFLWQALVDKVTGRQNPFIEIDTIAVLFCENIEFKMNSRQVTIGRSSKTTQVDIDLSIVKQNKKISRKQCKICLVDGDVFVIINNGNLPLFVDGKVIEKGFKTKISDKSIIEIDSYSLLFLVNYNILSPLNAKSSLLLPKELKSS